MKMGVFEQSHPKDVVRFRICLVNLWRSSKKPDAPCRFSVFTLSRYCFQSIPITVWEQIRPSRFRSWHKLERGSICTYWSSNVWVERVHAQFCDDVFGICRCCGSWSTGLIYKQSTKPFLAQHHIKIDLLRVQSHDAVISGEYFIFHATEVSKGTDKYTLSCGRHFVFVCRQPQ